MTERLPSPFASDELTTSEPSDPANELIGRVIGGRYKVTRIVGRGGMGVVYGGEHLELGIEVAIKVLPASYARDAETLKRFEREARTASRVRHPNVVTVFDLGRLGTGEPYLAMELLVGRDLSERVQPGEALPLAETIEILEPLAAALDALHKEGVVHRDIKPSNIFFTRSAGGAETLKLVDFGLAALHTTENDERLTRSGHVIGTAIYMAPEGARGALVGPAGDIYSLAVVAFELLTGLAPFDGQPMAVLMDKVSGTAPTLAAVGQRAYDARIEDALAAALSRHPEQRPATAMKLVDALRAALPTPSSDAVAAVPVVAPAPSASASSVALGTLPAAGTQRSTQPASSEFPTAPKSSRGPMIAAIVALLLLLTLGGAWLAQQGNVSPPATTPVVLAPTTPDPTPPIVPVEPVVVVPPPLAVEPVVPVVRTPPTTPAVTTPETTTAVVSARPDRVHGTPGEPPERVASTPTVAPTTATPATPEPTPDSTDRTASLLRDASSAMLHGEIPRAAQLYREATLAAPRNAAAWRGLGLACERIGLVPEARRAYTQYLEIAPDARDSATVRERLGRLGT